jgi:hypothetical protein
LEEENLKKVGGTGDKTTQLKAHPAIRDPPKGRIRVLVHLEGMDDLKSFENSRTQLIRITNHI